MYVYDCEVYAYDWVTIIKKINSNECTVVHNDNEALLSLIDENEVYIGFNSKHYDQYIIKAIASGCTPQEIKQVNNYIIGGGLGFECPVLTNKRGYFKFNNVDIRDDMQVGLSLKAIEGHLGLPIRECSVPFDIDRPLTEAELAEVIDYCKNGDIASTEKLIARRKDYLSTKIKLGQRAGIACEVAMAQTNAKLTAMMLRAERVERNDGRDYVYPENLDKSCIPSELLAFFDTIHDKSIPDETLFKTYCDIVLGDMPCRYAWGGVHGSVNGYYEEATATRVIQNRDVASLYPALLCEHHYLSRNVPDPSLFVQMRNDRVAAKHNGDKETAKYLKVPLNATSGAQENPYNDLYDPLMTRSMRISGQLFMTVLAVRLLRNCPSIKLLNFNTDGLMYSIDIADLDTANRIAEEWEKETQFELEVDDIQKVWIKDVNNLLIVKTDGSVKTVGGVLNHGISYKGAWNINTNMTIIKDAVREFFVNGTPVEQTINDCNDILRFQYIAKAGATYKSAYHLVDGVKVPIQKVNRIYATRDTRYGKLYKIKTETESDEKIASLPEHCIIDNDNQLSIDDIDKQFYIDTAKSQIDQFKGIKPEKKSKKKKESDKMAATATSTATAAKTNKPSNVYQKLIDARAAFIKCEVSKSGLNTHVGFQYLELVDIVPTITEIFKEIGLIAIESFTVDTGTITVVNTEKMDETITFTLPFIQMKPIVSNEGKKAMNEIQALGSSMTYYRRYLYMLAMDICVNDDFDSELGSDKSTAKKTVTVAAKPKQAPATSTTRADIAKQLTDTDGNATDLQIKGLKTALAKLKSVDPSKEEMIAKLAIDTKGLTQISKADCEKLTATIVKTTKEIEAKKE